MTQNLDHTVGAEGVQAWEDVDTTSPTPVADSLREFADEVEAVEETVGDDSRVDVYFTGDTVDDTQRINVEYGVDDA